MVLDYHDESDETEKNGEKRLTEFDCPQCNANNPYGDGFGVGDEIRCYYCGCEFKVVDIQGRKLKLREL